MSETLPDIDALVRSLRALPTRPVALEALWDGDTQGWFVNLFAVVPSGGSFDSSFVWGPPRGSDARLFQGLVPPWPEAQTVADVGARLAEALGVPLHFPSPERPEEDCPHWWEREASTPCSGCGMPLLQPPDLPWRGQCYDCHLIAAREARVQAWSEEERAAPKCWICGEPVVGAAEPSPRCSKCVATYRDYICPICGSESVVHVRRAEPESCDPCRMRARLARLSEEDARSIHAARTKGLVSGIRRAIDVLECSLRDAELTLMLLEERDADV